ncbi:hypothetical protein C8R43DRAFT_1203452, partial [Mycena crocata]
NTHFPSVTERWLWRVCALVITGLPTLLGAVQMLTEATQKSVRRSTVVNVLFGGTLFTYIVARVVLLVLPFMTLRGLPTAALLQINWTTYIPHF